MRFAIKTTTIIKTRCRCATSLLSIRSSSFSTFVSFPSVAHFCSHLFLLLHSVALLLSPFPPLFLPSSIIFIKKSPLKYSFLIFPHCTFPSQAPLILSLVFFVPYSKQLIDKKQQRSPITDNEFRTTAHNTEKHYRSNFNRYLNFASSNYRKTLPPLKITLHAYYIQNYRILSE